MDWFVPDPRDNYEFVPSKGMLFDGILCGGDCGKGFADNSPVFRRARIRLWKLEVGIHFNAYRLDGHSGYDEARVPAIAS